MKFFISVSFIFFYMVSFAQDQTDLETIPLVDSRNTHFRSYNKFDFKACEQFAGNSSQSQLSQLNHDQVQSEFFGELKKSLSDLVENSIKQVTYLRECLSGRPLPNCAENKSKFLADNLMELKKLRQNAALSTSVYEMRTNVSPSEVYKNESYTPSGSIKFSGTRVSVESLSEPEKVDFRQMMAKIRSQSMQEKLSRNTADRCVSGSENNYVLNQSYACTEVFRGRFIQSFKEKMDRENRARTDETDRILVKYPWLKNHKQTTLNQDTIKQGLTDQLVVMNNKLKEIAEMSDRKTKNLVGYEPLVEGVLGRQTNRVRQEAYCSVAQTAYRQKNNREMAANVGLFGIAILGVALCPFTSGITCLAISGVGAVGDAAFLNQSFNEYRTANADYTSGVISEDELIEKRNNFENNLAMAAFAGLGPAVSGVRGAAKVIRSRTVQESLGSLLSGSLRRNADNYFRGNARASKEADNLYKSMDELATSKPGYMSNELTSRIQSITTRVFGDIHPSNNLRFLKDYDEMIRQLGTTRKGSAEYNELIGRIELRTRALEAIYEKTSPGPFVQRVQEAINNSSVPPSIARDVEKCFITGTRSQTWLRQYFLNDAYATLRADQFCDIPIARILEKQDSQGWVTLPNGDRQRFLIEKWDCDDCGTTGLPAWVKVERANNKEDLAQVTHCPSCGNAKETHEPYYGAWQRNSRGEITNATQDDIVGAGGGRTQAREAANKDETYCGFCGTVHDLQSPQCKSCGAPSISHLTDPGRPEASHAPHAPRAASDAKLSSGNGRTVHREAERKTRAGKDDSTGPSNNVPIIAGGAAVAAVGGGGAYYMFKSTEVNATVRSMSWEHTITLERNVVVQKRDWRSSIPSSGFDIRNCNNEFSHNQDVACGTESYTISGSCSSSSSNGITVETCSPDTTGSRTKYCPEPVYREKCSYSIYQWQAVTSRSTSGGAPQGNGSLPWPNLTANGANERVSRRASYSLDFEFEAFGKPQTRSERVSSESDFKSWGVGNTATGTYRRASGLSNLKRN